MESRTASCQVKRGVADVFALNSISFLIDSGAMFGELKQFQVDGRYVVCASCHISFDRPEQKYHGPWQQRNRSIHQPMV